MIAMNIICWW